jgi:hypothetical protein
VEQAVQSFNKMQEGIIKVIA